MYTKFIRTIYENPSLDLQKSNVKILNYTEKVVNLQDKPQHKTKLKIL